MHAPIFFRGSPKGNIISGQKSPLGRILRNFRLRMRTPMGTPNGSRDLRSLPAIIVLVLLYYILYYYYSKKKCGGKPGMRRTYFRDFRSKCPTRAAIAQLPVTHVQNILLYSAISVTWLTWLPVAPPQIRLELSPYTTNLVQAFSKENGGLW
jgi:hypothetical protein